MIMNTYIKHSEDDSLTHYGVKGMKWRKRKAKKDAAFYYGQDKAYAKADRLYDKNKVYRKVMDHYGPENDSKSARRFRKTWNKAFDAYASAQSGKYRAVKALKKLKKKSLKSKKQSSSSNKKHHKMSNALQMERARYAMKESRRLNNGMPTRSRARTIIRYKNY